MERALEEGFQHVSIDTWLVVIPQIIARIHSPSAPVRNLIHSLLIRIGRHHPQVHRRPNPNPNPNPNATLLRHAARVVAVESCSHAQHRLCSLRCLDNSKTERATRRSQRFPESRK